MKPEIKYSSQRIEDPIKAQSYVTAVTFLIKQPGGDINNRSYFFKEPGIQRSRDLGVLEYEERGYQLLDLFGIPVPEHRMGTKKGIPVLATSLVEGVALSTLSNIQTFRSALDLTLSQHFEMWRKSERLLQSDSNALSDIHKTDPVLEAFNTAKQIEPILGQFSNLPHEFTECFKKVVTDLDHACRYQLNKNNPLFFQHGEEILVHHIYNQKDGKVLLIDPTCRLTTRMERAVNRLLAGSLIFNFNINNDGHPAQVDKAQALIDVVKKYAKMVEEFNSESGIQPTIILKELVFINITRVAYGIFNSENASYFNPMDLSKFTTLALNLFNELSGN